MSVLRRLLDEPRPVPGQLAPEDGLWVWGDDTPTGIESIQVSR